MTKLNINFTPSQSIRLIPQNLHLLQSLPNCLILYQDSSIDLFSVDKNQLIIFKTPEANGFDIFPNDVKIISALLNNGEELLKAESGDHLVIAIDGRRGFCRELFYTKSYEAIIRI